MACVCSSIKGSTIKENITVQFTSILFASKMNWRIVRKHTLRLGVCENLKISGTQWSIESGLVGFPKISRFPKESSGKVEILPCCIAAYKICKYTVQCLLASEVIGNTNSIRTCDRVLNTWTLWTLSSSIAETFGKLGRIFQNLCEFNEDWKCWLKRVKLW